MGEEKWFSGNLRANTLYNTVDFNVEHVEPVVAEELMKELSV